MEEKLISIIENSIRALKMGTKKPVDVAKETNKAITALKLFNVGMAEELNKKYINAVKEFNK
jgi:hypothetical protein